MELNSLLKYQSVDTELRNLKKEIASNDNCKIAEESRRQFNDMKATVEKSENLAAKVYGGYAESVKHYDETVKKAEELMERLADESISIEEADRTAKSLEAINAKLAEISEFIASIRKKGEEAVREFSNAQKNGLELKNKYVSAKNEIKKLEQEYMPKIKKLQDEAAETRKTVDPKLLEIYDKLTGDGRYPAFVEVYIGDDKKTMNCSACGYGLSLNTQSELKENGYCVCEKCRRIVYLAKK